jgi:hypothetical protein
LSCETQPGLLHLAAAGDTYAEIQKLFSSFSLETNNTRNLVTGKRLSGCITSGDKYTHSSYQCGARTPFTLARHEDSSQTMLASRIRLFSDRTQVLSTMPGPVLVADQPVQSRL